MVKVFVAQTHPNERNALVNYLGFQDIEAVGFEIGHDAIDQLTKAIQDAVEPLIVITSQSNFKGEGGLGNRVANMVNTAKARKQNVPALVIVYSRAVGNERYRDKLDEIRALNGNNNLSIVFVSKILPDDSPSDEDQIQAQHDAVKNAIDSFVAQHSTADLK